MSATLVFLLLLSGLFVVLVLVGIFWSIRSGQFDDLEGPAQRILMDDDDPRLPGRKTNGKSPRPAEPIETVNNEFN